MSPDAPSTPPRPSASVVVRRHLVLVGVFVVLGAIGGWFYGSSAPTTYTSTARVLVNPSVGNPFVPSASAVRQDELTSMETEAQVARSAEVLRTVAVDHPLTTAALQAGLQIVVPPNTQVLEISWTGADGVLAQEVTAAVAKSYLENRVRRFDAVNTHRIDQVDTQTARVVADLEAATAASHSGTPAARSFQSELATALRNELVGLRAQRTALETSAAPAGSVIAPATSPKAARDLVATAAPVLGALGGLLIGYLCALLRERLGRAVGSVAEVEAAGLRVTAVPRPALRDRLLRRGNAAAVEVTIRHLRAGILDAEPSPASIAIAAPSAQRAAADAVAVSEALAASIARSGHAAVLVRTTSGPATNGLVLDDGLTELLQHDRLDVRDLLHSTVEPLLCVLPSGAAGPHLADLLLTDRVRPVLETLAEAGNVVVVQSPGLDSPEGEAVARAATTVIVVVTLGRTPRAALERAVRAAAGHSTVVGLVLNRHDTTRRPPAIADEPGAAHAQVSADRLGQRLRARR
jgi:polysaccharide biosynthesis transport protein